MVVVRDAVAVLMPTDGREVILRPTRSGADGAYQWRGFGLSPDAGDLQGIKLAAGAADDVERAVAAGLDEVGGTAVPGPCGRTAIHRAPGGMEAALHKMVQ
jgi:hypothetical protein